MEFKEAQIKEGNVMAIRQLRVEKERWKPPEPRQSVSTGVVSY